MKPLKALFLTAFIIIVVVGGVVYAQSISNMILYTETDLNLWKGVQLENLTIPRFVGEDRDYLINITYRIENPTKVSIILRTFGFSISIDNGEPGSPYDSVRLLQEKIGSVGFAKGVAGPRIDSDKSYTESFIILVRSGSPEIIALNHTDSEGRYTVVIYDLQVAYSYVGSDLLREFYSMPEMRVVSPSD